MYYTPEKTLSHVTVGEEQRKLAVSRLGNSEGTPVFMMHGTPGSRVGILPRTILLWRMGICLISYDRPGYGLSDRHEGRVVADCADDVAAIADHFGYERFAIVGRSGGGPHALACAAKLGPRVTKAAVLVSPAPKSDVDGLWANNMTSSNVAAFEAEEQVAIDDILGRAARAQDNPEAILDEIADGLRPEDARVVGDIALRTKIIDSYREGLRSGPYGWLDDVLAFRRPWGFELSDIETPVTIWHGGDDCFSPIHHAYRLAEGIGSNARLMVEPGLSHFSAVPEMPAMFAAMAHGD